MRHISHSYNYFLKRKREEIRVGMKRKDNLEALVFIEEFFCGYLYEAFISSGGYQLIF